MIQQNSHNIHSSNFDLYDPLKGIHKSVEFSSVRERQEQLNFSLPTEIKILHDVNIQNFDSVKKKPYLFYK